MPLRLRESRQCGREDQGEREDHDNRIIGRADGAFNGRFVEEPDGYHQQDEDDDRN